MNAGRLIRMGRALDAAADKPCPNCGHPIGNHSELQPERIEIRGREVIRIANPNYRPLEFHCGECKCVYKPEEKR